MSGSAGVWIAVTLLVDSGAKYSVLPRRIWRKLGLTPKRSLAFILADGTRIERRVSECRLRMSHGETATPVILGEGADKALLGAVTLEELGVMLNPFTRELVPMKMHLASVS